MSIQYFYVGQKIKIVSGQVITTVIEVLEHSVLLETEHGTLLWKTKKDLDEGRYIPLPKNYDYQQQIIKGVIPNGGRNNNTSTYPPRRKG